VASSDGVTVFATSNDVAIYRSTDQVGWLGRDYGSKEKEHTLHSSEDSNE